MAIRTNDEGTVIVLRHCLAGGRLQTRRLQPLVDMCSGLRLSRLAQFRLAFPTGRKQFRFLAQALHLADQAIFERLSLFEAATLEHALLPCCLKAGARSVSRPPTPDCRCR